MCEYLCTSNATPLLGAPDALVSMIEAHASCCGAQRAPPEPLEKHAIGRKPVGRSKADLYTRMRLQAARPSPQPIEYRALFGRHGPCQGDTDFAHLGKAWQTLERSVQEMTLHLHAWRCHAWALAHEACPQSRRAWEAVPPSEVRPQAGCEVEVADPKGQGLKAPYRAKGPHG